MGKTIEHLRFDDDFKGVTVVYEVGENELHVSFLAVEIEAENCWENGEYRGRGYEDPEGTSNLHLVYNPEQGVPFVQGSVKWDGCVNYEVGDQDLVMMHACGLPDLRRVSRVLEAVYRRSAELMPKNIYSESKL